MKNNKGTKHAALGKHQQALEAGLNFRHKHTDKKRIRLTLQMNMRNEVKGTLTVGVSWGSQPCSLHAFCETAP